MESDFFAATILHYLEAVGDFDLSRLRGACLNHLDTLWVPNSGFADSQQSEPCLFATYYATISHSMLGVRSKRFLEGARSYLREISAGGGLPCYRDHPPDTLNAFWATVTASIVGTPEELIGRQVLDFLQDCRRENGSYSSTPGDRVGRLQPTVEALIIRRLYGQEIDAQEADKISLFIDACQSPGGGFGELPRVSPTPSDSLMGAVGMRLLGRPVEIDGLRVRCTDLWQGFTDLVVAQALGFK